MSLQHHVDRILGRLPLRTVLVASFVLQITAAVGLTAWLSFRNGQMAVNDLAAQLSREITSRIEEHVDGYLGQTTLLQRQSYSTITGDDLPLDDLEALGRHFWHQLQAADGLTSIYFGNPQGEFVGVQRRSHGVTVLWLVEPGQVPQRYTYRLDQQGRRQQRLASQPYDPRRRPWYTAAIAARTPIWSPIYRFASQDYSHLGITPAVPLYDEQGQLQGVIAIDLTLQQISEFLRQLDITPSGQAFIIERDGTMVASSFQEPPFVMVNGKPTRLLASDSQNELIRTTSQRLFQRFGGFQQIETGAQIRFTVDGERQLVEVRPFADQRGLDWLIVSVIPEADVMGQIANNTRMTLWLCGLALLLAGAIATITARQVSQPILSLHHAARALARGHWHQPLPRGRFREIDGLASAFRRMATQLQASFQNLAHQNAELHRLDKLKDEFLANTSHELKTPLYGIIGLAESLMDGATGPLPRRTKANLAMIAASGRRLSHLVNDILDFSHLRHNRLELTLTSVGIREAADVVLTLNRTLAQQKGLQLINAVSPALPPVLADENRLQQILHNLVDNAIKFTEVGMIGISAQLGSDPTAAAAEYSQVAITVSDTGIGIPAQQQSQIFYPFEQGDSSIARQYGGMGIGLAVTQQLVELHGGSLTVNSSPGIGSQFTVTLPVATEAAVTAQRHRRPLFRDITEADVMADPDGSVPMPVSEPTGLEPEHRPFTILVVDDEPVNRQVIYNHLTVQHYQVVMAVDGPSALAQLAQGTRPDVILLDVMMPGLTGYEVCRRIREQYPAQELPILMLTAKHQVADLVEGLSAGANDYLTKPVSKRELLARLKTHLHLSKINLAYSRFVPREFLQFLNKESIVEVTLGDQVEKHLSIMFADILDFTSLSEQMSPAENFRFINAFLSRMEPAIAENGGFIDKYIGDAIMALFSGGADQALQASLAMLQRLQTYNQERLAQGQPIIQIGIGINTGYTMLGTVGGENRMDGTAISDTVNVAARIERLTRPYGTALLISHHTFLQLQNANRYAMRVIDRVQVRGKTRFTSVYEVFEVDSPESRAAKLATKTNFETGLLLYFQGQFSAAMEKFTACIRYYADDSVARVYLERCRHQATKG